MIHIATPLSVPVHRDDHPLSVLFSEALLMECLAETKGIPVSNLKTNCLEQLWTLLANVRLENPEHRVLVTANIIEGKLVPGIVSRWRRDDDVSRAEATP